MRFGEYPDFAVDEVACTTAMRQLGHPVAPLELETMECGREPQTAVVMASRLATSLGESLDVLPP